MVGNRPARIGADRPPAFYDAGVELRGSLHFASLTDMLLLLEASSQSGVLRLDGESEVWFHDGQISYGTYVGCPSLRAALVGYRIIDDGQWEDAVLSDSGQGTGAALDALPGISRERLRRVLRERIVDTVTPYLPRHGIECTFDAGRYHHFGPLCRVPVDVVLAEASMRRRQWREIAKIVPTLTCVPRCSGFDAPVNPEHVWLLTHVDGCRTVAELAHVTGASAYVVSATLRRLVLAGAVAIGPARPLVAAAMSPAATMSMSPPTATTMSPTTTTMSPPTAGTAAPTAATVAATVAAAG